MDRSGRIWSERRTVRGHLVDQRRMATKGPGEVQMQLEDGTQMQTVTLLSHFYQAYFF